MEFIELAKSYLEIGILGLCGIFVVGFAWIAFKKLNERNDELIKAAQEREAELLKKVDAKCDNAKYDQLFQTIMEQNKKSQDLLQEQLKDITSHIIDGVTTHRLSHDENNTLSENESKINECLKRTQQKTNSARVALVRFHNGGRDMNGLSFLKMSMTNECPGEGFAGVLPQFQNLFRSFFSYWCECLIKEGKCYIPDIEEIKTKDTTMYEYFTSRGIESVYGISIVNTEYSVVGFIIIEFMDKSKVDEKQIESCLHDKKIKIETILNLG